MKRFTLTQAGLTLLLGAMLATPSLAKDKAELGMPNGNAGVQKTAAEVKRDMLEKAGVDSKTATRLTGTLRYTPQHGLRLGNTKINVRPSTTIYPSSHDKMPSARELNGRLFTVYGKKGPDGSINATLLIHKSHTVETIQFDKNFKAPEGFTPSQSNPAVGEISEDVKG